MLAACAAGRAGGGEGEEEAEAGRDSARSVGGQGATDGGEETLESTERERDCDQVPGLSQQVLVPRTGGTTQPAAQATTTAPATVAATTAGKRASGSGL